MPRGEQIHAGAGEGNREHAVSWKTIGQDHLLARLTPALEGGRESHAYLLTGPPRVGKFTLAREIAQALNCRQGPGAPCHQCTQCERIAANVHADIRVVDIEFSRTIEGRDSVTSITIDAVRELERTINLNPFEGTRTVIIIDGAADMRVEAQNALLKTLEEPPPGVVLLLLAEDEGTLLPTIQSRCQPMRLLPLSKYQMTQHLTGEKGIPEAEADMLHRLSRGCLGWALNALNEPEILRRRNTDTERMQETITAGLDAKFAYANEVATLFGSDRPAGREILYLWLHWWRDLLMLKHDGEAWLLNTGYTRNLQEQANGLTSQAIAKFLRRLEATLAALDSNANPKLALETLMVNME